MSEEKALVIKYSTIKYVLSIIVSLLIGFGAGYYYKKELPKKVEIPSQKVEIIKPIVPVSSQPIYGNIPGEKTTKENTTPQYTESELRMADYIRNGTKKDK